MRALIEGLRRLPQRTLWVIDEQDHWLLPAQLPPALQLRLGTRSTSMYAVLRQPTVRLFVSSCGLTAAQEALYFGKVLLCVPFSPHETEVATRLGRNGVAVALRPKTHANDTEGLAEQVRAAAAALMQDEEARRKAEHLGRVLRAAGGLGAAAALVETVLELGTDDLRLLEDLQPWYQYLVLDVVSVYAGFLFGVAVVFRTLWSALVILHSPYKYAARGPSAERGLIERAWLHALHTRAPSLAVLGSARVQPNTNTRM